MLYVIGGDKYRETEKLLKTGTIEQTKKKEEICYFLTRSIN